MKEAGYDNLTIARTQAAVGKRGLKVNPDTQLLEDTVGLVFIERYLVGFVAQHPEYDEAKWTGILRKTWGKMSDRAHEFILAGKIRLPESLTPLIFKTIKGGSMSEPTIAVKSPAKIELEAGKNYAWCACGLSKSQPLCDGSHKTTDLRPLIFKVEEKKTVYLCQCKRTKNPPYCDGTHKVLP